MNNKSTTQRLRAYGSLALSSTALLANHADAATVVDINAASFDTGLAGIGTVGSFNDSYTTPGHHMPGYWTGGYIPGGGGPYYGGGKGTYVPGPYVPGTTHTTNHVTFSSPASGLSGQSFVRGSDLTSVANSGASSQFQFGAGDGSITSGFDGAMLGSDDNWFLAVSATDPGQSVWLQFAFGDGSSSTPSVSIVKAVYESTPGELPTAFAASTAVPEPSTLALLAMGAGGLFIRRRKQAA